MERLSRCLERLDVDDLSDDPVERLQALSLARRLCSKLETPQEAATRMVVIEPATMAAVMISIDCGIFQQLDMLKPQECTSAQLAKSTGVEQALMERLLRLLASVRIIDEVGSSLYSPTDFSSALRGEVLESGFRHNHATIQPVLSRLPFYFQEHGFTTPKNFAKGPFQYGQRTAFGLWEWYKENPEYASYFNSWMSGTHAPEKETWLDAYPISALLAPVADENALSVPLVVDLGGGQGKDMELLRQRLLPRQFDLVVQDQQPVVDKAKHDYPRLTFMAHDFFEDQPINHARAYFIHSTLHNWPDEKVRQILSALRPAFRPNFSLLLLSESIMPERGASALQTCVDFNMMALFCVRSRTLQNWRQLLESSGFKLNQVWVSLGRGSSVIEAEPAD